MGPRSKPAFTTHAIPEYRTRRLYRQIADQIRELIRAGEFVAGARLPPERDLAKQLGVSRPSVREALIALEVEGLVEVRIGSGIYVLGPGQKSEGDEVPAGAWRWPPGSARHSRSLRIDARPLHDRKRMRGARGEIREEGRRSSPSRKRWNRCIANSSTTSSPSPATACFT
jgi:DNA-binding transcriptional MocR family regulator